MSEYNTYMNMAPANPAVAAVKKTSGSVIFLIATITYTLAALLSLVSLFTPTAAYADLMYEITGDMSYYYSSSLDGVSILISLVGMIPTFLAAIGLWMAFGASKTKKPKVSTGGFTLISGALITQLVCMCILMAFVVIVMIIAIITVASYVPSWSYYGYSEFGSDANTAIAVLIIATVIIVLIFVLAIVYYAKAVGSVRTVKKAANGVLPASQVSMYVIVMNFIVAGLSVVGIVSNLAMGAGALSLFSSLFSLAYNVLITIALIQFRGRMNQVELQHANENAMNNTGYNNYNTGSYDNYNTGSYDNFNTGSVPVQPQYEQYQQPQYQQPQYQQPQGQPYGQYQQYQQPTGGYQYQQPQGQPYGQVPQYQQPTGGYQYQQPQDQSYGQAPQYQQPTGDYQYQQPQYQQPQAPQQQEPEESWETDNNDQQ